MAKKKKKTWQDKYPYHQPAVFGAMVGQAAARRPGASPLVRQYVRDGTHGSVRAMARQSAAEGAARRAQLLSQLDTIASRHDEGHGSHGFGNVVGGALRALDTPRRAFFGLAEQSGQQIAHWIDPQKGHNFSVSELGKEIVDDEAAAAISGGAQLKALGAPGWAQAVGGFTLDVAGDPLTYATLGAGAAAKGTEHGAVAVLKGAEKELAEKAAAKGFQEVGEQGVRKTVDDFARELADKGDTELVDLMGEHRRAVAGARRYGSAGLSQEDWVRYTGERGRGMQFKTSSIRRGAKVEGVRSPREAFSFIIPGTDSKIAQKAGRTLAEGRARAGDFLLGAGKPERLGKIIGSETTRLTRAAARSGGERSFAAVATRVARQESEAVARSLKTTWAKEFGKVVGKMNDEEFDGLSRAIQGDNAARAVVGEERVAGVENLLARIHKEATDAGIRINQIDGYMPSPLSADAKRVFAEAFGGGADQGNAFRSFAERGRTFQADENGVFHFMGDTLATTNRQEAIDWANRKIREVATKEGLDDIDVEALQMFDDTRTAMSKYFNSMSRRIGQTRAAGKLADQGIGNASRELITQFADPTTAAKAANIEAALAKLATQGERAAARADTAEMGAVTRSQELLGQRLDELQRVAQGENPIDVAPQAQLRYEKMAAQQDRLDEQVQVANEILHGEVKAKKGAIGVARDAVAAAEEQADVARQYLADTEDVLQDRMVRAQGEADRIGGLINTNEYTPEVKAALTEHAQALRDAARWGKVQRDAVRMNDTEMAKVAAYERAAADARSQVAKVGDMRRTLMNDFHALPRIEKEKLGQLVASKIQREIKYGLGTPEDVAHWLTVAEKAKDPSEINGLMKTYNKFYTYIKQHQLLSPGFSMRNAYGAGFQNWAHDIDLNSHTAWGSILSKARVSEKTLTERQRILFERIHDVVGRGQYGHEFEQVLQSVGGNNRATLNPFSNRFAAFRLNQKLGSGVETYFRGAVVMDTLLKRGMNDVAVEELDDFIRANLDEGINLVNKIHFDYDDLSKVEQGIRKVVPFYTWVSRNLPLQIEMMARNPKVYARIEQARMEIERQSTPDETVPGFFNDLGAIRLPFKTPDGAGHQYLTPDIPLQDLMDATANRSPEDVFGWAAGQVTPIIKTPIEATLDKQFFKDLPIDETQYTNLPYGSSAAAPLMRALGLAEGGPDGKTLQNEQQAYILDQLLPWVGRLRRLAPNDDPQYANKRGARIASFFGAGVRSNDETAQRNARYFEQAKPKADAATKHRNRRRFVEGSR